MGYPSAEYLRAYRARKRLEWDALPKIPCACGCGTMIPPINRNWQPAKYAQRHRAPQAPGFKHTPETIERLREIGSRVAHRGPDHYMFGKHHPPEVRAKISEANSGENSWNWRGGTGSLPYGPEFTAKFKRLIRERDGNACRRCGKTKEQNGPTKRTLQVHHLDHNKMNNDPSNIVTSCGSCNVWAWWHKDEPFLPHN